MTGACLAYLLAGALFGQIPTIVHNIQLRQQARRQEAIIRVTISKDLRDGAGICRFTGRSENCDSVKVGCPDQHQHHADYVQGREESVDVEVLGQVHGQAFGGRVARCATHSRRTGVRWALIIGLGGPVVPKVWKTDMASSLANCQALVRG